MVAKDPGKLYLRKLRAARAAEFALRQRLQRIEWEESELLPELDDAKASIVNQELPSVPDIVVESDDDSSDS